MRSRRTFLGLLGGAAVTWSLPATALAEDGSFDVSYLWAKDLEALLDYRQIVGDLLGPQTARNLIVVRGGSGNWGLLLDRDGTSRGEAKKVASEHHRLLKKTLGGSETMATVLPDRGFDRTYHVRYGVYPTAGQAREAFRELVQVMGPDVERHLTVEQVRPSRWHVIYKRYGTRRSTERVVLAHRNRLEGKGFELEAIADRYRNAEWAAGSTDGESIGATRTTLVYPDHRATERPSVASSPTPRAAPPAEPRIEQPAPPVPPVADTEALGDLPAAIRTPLRNAINQHVQKLRKTGKIESDERTSWYVHTLHDDRTWAAINAELHLQCASMFKPYVALAFLHRASEGRIIYGEKSKGHLEKMIQYSSNDSTNWAMQQVGGPRGVQDILERHYSHVFKETEITELIPKNGRTYKNRSSARDYVRFARALWKDELAGAAEIRRLMALPGRDRLVTGAPSIPSSTKVMNKTGTTSHLVGDFGILVAPAKDGTEIPYAIVGIIEKRNRARSFSRWTASRSTVIRGVSNLVYEQLRGQYALA